MGEYEDQPRVKRFKHQSYHQSLKEVHLAATHNHAQVHHEITDGDSHFHQGLDHWRQLNLSPGFLSFADKAESLSASMPLLLHNWEEIINLWLCALESSDDEGLRALLDLLQKMAHDLRTTLSPVYPHILDCLLKLLSRSISPAALTVLLETFSSLFKFLLVASIQTTLLEQTWAAVRSTLPSCLPEIQRAMAEVWGSVLRRLRTAAREKAVILLAQSAEGADDASAWVFVFACKSVSQSLHTATVSIMTPLLKFVVSSGTFDTSHLLIRRVLTALIHHVKNAEQYSPVGDLLVRQFTTVTKSTDPTSPQDLERLQRILEIVSISCSVRRGSRLTQSQLDTLCSQLTTMPLVPALHSSLLKFTTAVLTAGEMPLWLGPGHKFIQRAWSESKEPSNFRFTLRLNACLAELEWGGWRLVALPLLLRMTPGILGMLELDSRMALEFIAALVKGKKLTVSDTNVVWRDRVEKFVLGRLENWSLEAGVEAAIELNDILTISSLLSPAITPVVVDIIGRILVATGDTADENRNTANNSAWALGVCMQALVNRDVSEWSDLVDTGSWARTCIKHWGWSHEVIGGLYCLSQASPSTSGSVPLEDVYPALQEYLLSHSRLLRLYILRLLASNLISSPAGATEVIRRCLQGEELSLDLQGVRERMLRIGRVGQILRDGDEVGADISTRWLIAQLKVNLRPIWSPASGALSSLSERFGDTVWRLLFQEIQLLGEARSEEVFPKWTVDEDDRLGGKDDVWEEERSWRDPSAHKFRMVITRWLDDLFAQSDFVKAQTSKERLDLYSYESQLLSTLGECSSLAEKHNRELVPQFLALADHHSLWKLPKQKLIPWLTLFSKFHNPKAIYSTNLLHTLYLSLLSHPDRALQRIALTCLLTYKSPHLTSHEDKIRMLLDETRWRDELTSLDFNAFSPQDRTSVVDVIIRLLFGMMLEKKGRSRGADRRAAILGALGGCTEEELSLLVDLMLRPLNSSCSARREAPFILISVGSNISDRQQTGFLILLGDVIKALGPLLVQYWPSLIGVTIDLIGDAQRRVENSLPPGAEAEMESGETVEEVEGVEDSGSPSPSPKVVRSIRQLGLKRLTDFFRSPVQFDFAPYLEASFTSFISPRLDLLDKENIQAPSALLELFYTWSLHEDYMKYLVHYDIQVLPKIYACLVAPSVKPTVITRIFDIVDNILAASSVNESIRDAVVKPHVSLLLSNLIILVQRSKGTSLAATPLAQRQIKILSEIAQYLTDSEQAETLFSLFAVLLRKPAKLVTEKVKVDLLKIISNLMSLVPRLSDRTSEAHMSIYKVLSQLFQSLHSLPSRLGLVSAFHCFATLNSELQDLAALIESLNAYSSKRLDEPDFERRLTAFSLLNETLCKSLSCLDWLPLLYNMLYFIQDPIELTIRNNASLTLRQFVDLVKFHPSSDFEVTFLDVVLPGIKNGLRSKNEMVRSEILGVLGYAVEKCGHLGSLQEMRVLLAGGDEEANFFNNILHVQIHRRSRALRRLADHCDEGYIRSSTLADVFVPLIGNYIVSTISVDHHLVNDAISTTGRMARHLTWRAYYTLVRKYLQLSRAKDQSERVYVRALVAVLDNFHFPMEEVVLETKDTKLGGSVDEEADGDEGDEPEVEEQEPIPTAIKASAASQMARTYGAVSLRLLPELLSHLEKHDVNTDDNTRIPVAIGIVTVAKHLPVASREAHITRLLTILSQILRSRSQETRDLVRDALSRIAEILGPAYLSLIFRELRATLLRGPQLHVLAYVTHAILVHVTSGKHAEAFEILDDCVNDIAYVSAEVIFGESGKDVQSDDFKTKMREVRSSASKGLDSFAVVAKYITPSKFSSLLLPLRSIMQETESIKVLNLVEEVLKRIAGGLNSNKHLVPTELLVLCNTLITQNARFLHQAPPRRKQSMAGDAIVQVKRQEAMKVDHYANNSFRFVTFGLDLLQTALRRNRFDFHDDVVMARLDAMIIVVGNTLYSTSAPVILLGLRCAAGLAKCPLKSLDKSLPVFVRQTINIIQQAGSTESEIVQVALKSLATILREGPAVQVKEKDLAYLLELLSPDLEEPSRQTSVFAMLRAIVARKFVVPEIYDLMDKVSEIMVTSQSPQVQELCRGVLLQFLLDYPQGKGRLRKQMTFLAKNLSYVFESGRKSVMELLGAVISKFEVTLIQTYSDLLFVALVMVVANDDSAKCKEMASLLIKPLFMRLDDIRRKDILSHLHSWASQKAQPQLAQVSSQVYGFIIDILQEDSLPYADRILEDFNAALEHSAQAFAALEAADVNDGAMAVDLDWQGPYHALIVLEKSLRIFPDFATHGDKVRWKLVIPHLLFPHAWVRIASCRLLGLLFTAVPVKPPGGSYADDHPLSVAGMRDTAIKLCLQLKSEHLDDALGLQIVKNLFYVGKCFNTIQLQELPLEVISDEGEIEEANDSTSSNSANPLPWLFSKLSYQVRSAHIARRNRTSSSANWSQQPLSILRWFAAMASHMDVDRLERFLIHILNPVYRLLEDDTIHDSQIEELKTLATELQDLVQTKVGMTKFSMTYNQIRQSVLGVRRDRKATKVLQVATNPEAAARRKIQRNIVKKESRKRKDRGYADRLGKLKRRRED